VQFIKTPGAFERAYKLTNTAPRFRKTFTVTSGLRHAEVRYAGLGLGYCYLNGKPITADRFTPPYGNYNQTVWYNRYDVTSLLREGENAAAAIIGNGFYNETFATLGKVSTASWRDKPKLWFTLTLTYDDRTETIASDATWWCTDISPILFNQIRSGEYYDARLYEHGWNDVGFDDTTWASAVIDGTPPTGVLRECMCEPIRECEMFSPVSITKTGENRYLFTFPRTISGYISLRTGSLCRGQKLVIRYAECIHADGSLDLKTADSPKFYPESRFAWDEFIADGADFTWSPRFAYHGFRYIQIDGLTMPPTTDMVSAVSVHEDIPRKTTFSCSDSRLNRLFDMGIQASLSNFFYLPTDCPSREKLGWANDAQSSMEQFLLNFDAERMLRKWFTDILDAMRSDGALPAVIPTENYGYDWGAGPTSTGVLFELPYQIWNYTGKSDLLIAALPYFSRHLAYIRSRSDERGLIDYGLCDWSGPWDDPQHSPTPVACSNTLLYLKFLQIYKFAAILADELQTAAAVQQEYDRMRGVFLRHYMTSDGRLTVGEQCALAIAIVLHVCGDNTPLAAQLTDVLARDKYHINCGMLGIRYLFRALDLIGRSDLAYRLITAEGYPGYFHWISAFDAATLLEMWSGEKSHNHHMYSDVLVWLFATLGGIKSVRTDGQEAYEIAPYCPDGIEWCAVSRETGSGILAVRWERSGDAVAAEITVPEGLTVTLHGKPLTGGTHRISRIKD